MFQKLKDICKALKEGALITLVNLTALLFFTILMILIRISPKIEMRICKFLKK